MPTDRLTEALEASGWSDPATCARIDAWLSEPHHYVLPLDDERYPALLRETGQGPAVLFVDGDPEVLNLPQLAIVGSRSATPAGLEIAHEFAAYLGRAGLIITSGLALGIDAAAHGGALAGGGRTVAVLGCGPDLDYPRANAALARQISGNGARVSEFPPGFEARRHQFPQRNRIIAGLSLGTLVVEAGIQSGSLITARQAGEFGREVFAVPGSIHSPVSKGCHQLIRQGAKLVEKAADIMEELGEIAGSLIDATARSAATASGSGTRLEPDPDYAKLVEAMGFDPVTVDTLVTRTGLTADQLSSMLLILELQGQVDTLPGGRFQRLATRNASQ